MPRRPNPTIGHVPCAFCTELGAVRKAKGGTLYYVCACGGPHYAHEHVLEHGKLWGDAGPPDDIPLWIQKGLRFPPGTRNGHDRPRMPSTSPEPSASSSTEPAPAQAPSTPEPAAELAPPVPAPPPEPSTSSRPPARMSFGLFR